jgi:hypothetical protein
MSLSPQALFRGLVQRVLPSAPNADSQNNDVAVRQWSYGELATQPMIRKSHALADEGSYFIANNVQTAQNRPIGTSFSAIVPWFIIQNQSQSNRLYLDYLAITAVTATTAASAAVATFLAIVIDSTLRFSANGTALTPVNPNMASVNASGAAIWSNGGSALAATAASAAARTLVGQRILRPAASATALSVVGDFHLLTFGGVEGAAGQTAATASIMPQNLPPVIVGPGMSAVIYTWLSATTPAAGTDIGEIGFFVR